MLKSSIMLNLKDFKEVLLEKNVLTKVTGGVTVVGSSKTADGTTKDLEFEDGQVMCDIEDGHASLFF